MVEGGREMMDKDKDEMSINCKVGLDSDSDASALRLSAAASACMIPQQAILIDLSIIAGPDLPLDLTVLWASPPRDLVSRHA